MPIPAKVPASLTTAPFRGSAVISQGLLTMNMLRGSSWRRLLPDVYAHAALPIDHRMRCAAVALVMPAGTAVGGPSAAHLWGADLLLPDPPVSVVTPRDGWMRRLPRISVHRTVFGRDDITRHDGIRTTTPERTAFDIGRRLPRDDAVILLDAMLRHGSLDAGAVTELARCRPRWPNVARLRAALALADARAESPMETRLRLLVHDAGLPAARPQFEVRDIRGRVIARVDLAWPAARLAAEYEGDHHRERDQYRRDVERTSALQRLGWSVLRFTADDVLHRPRETAVALITELSRRR